MADMSLNGAIATIARKCSMARIVSGDKPGGCTDYVGGKYCYNCQYYIGKYMNADPNHIKLYMINSDEAVRNDMARIKYNKKVDTSWTKLYIALICGAMAMVSVWKSSLVNRNNLIVLKGRSRFGLTNGDSDSCAG